MAYCNHCGAPINDCAKFCSECGTKNVVEDTTIAQRRTVFEGEIHKCPNCGEIVKTFDASCPACGFELRGKAASNSVELLSQRLENAKSEEQRIIIVKSFPVPNTKEDIFEFMLLALGNFDLSYYEEHLFEDDISDAWLAKVEQCYQKAKLTLKGTKDFLEIEELYNSVNGKIKNYNDKVERVKQKKDKEKRIKKLIWGGAATIIFIALVLFICLSIYKANYDPNLITIGMNSYNVTGERYDDIVEVLTEKGFTNIEAINDGWKKEYDVGDVTKISIGGETSFNKKSKFDKDTKVIIYYCSEPKSIMINFVYEDFIGEKYTDVVDAFESLGFKNIETREENNIFKKNETVKEILFDGIKGFETSSEYEESVKIVIVYY